MQGQSLKDWIEKTSLDKFLKVKDDLLGFLKDLMVQYENDEFSLKTVLDIIPTDTDFICGCLPAFNKQRIQSCIPLLNFCSQYDVTLPDEPEAIYPHEVKCANTLLLGSLARLAGPILSVEEYHLLQATITRLTLIKA